MRSLMQETVEHEQPELLVPKGKKPRVSYPDYMRGFWGALVHAKEIDGSLQLPEPHVWSPDHGNKIFVRGCYRELADAILNDAGLESNDSPVPLKKGTHYWTILGNPGSCANAKNCALTFHCRHWEDGVHILPYVPAAEN